ncbi:hypothetical protein L2E82_45957 [Cichorium intybus]|uniref:Uncharacterized protein n=1 Tax=Cichorium intybus TaxID=13427 RepID=A0ACB8ZUX9_CICIN|nr:hypothetical protein L2E82_45957 [Cichorium intybus]
MAAAPVIHSIKVGIALVLVSLLYLLDPLFEQVGENAILCLYLFLFDDLGDLGVLGVDLGVLGVFLGVLGVFGVCSWCFGECLEVGNKMVEVGEDLVRDGLRGSRIGEWIGPGWLGGSQRGAACECKRVGAGRFRIWSGGNGSGLDRSGLPDLGWAGTVGLVRFLLFLI